MVGVVAVQDLGGHPGITSVLNTSRFGNMPLKENLQCAGVHARTRIWDVNDQAWRVYDGGRLIARDVRIATIHGDEYRTVWIEH